MALQTTCLYENSRDRSIWLHSIITLIFRSTLYIFVKYAENLGILHFGPQIAVLGWIVTQYKFYYLLFIYYYYYLFIYYYYFFLYPR